MKKIYPISKTVRENEDVKKVFGVPNIEELLNKYSEDSEPELKKMDINRGFLKECVICGRRYYDSYFGKTPLCSKPCINKWLETRPKVCKYCQKNFFCQNLIAYRTQKYCSKECKKLSERPHYFCEYCHRDLTDEEPRIRLTISVIQYAIICIWRN